MAMGQMPADAGSNKICAGDGRRAYQKRGSSYVSLGTGRRVFWRDNRGIHGTSENASEGGQDSVCKKGNVTGIREMDKERVAVIVVTPSSGDDLDRCLASLARQTTPPHEVAVVINGDRASASRLDRWKTCLPLSVTILDRNEGFAAPHALVLPSLESEWIAVLNDDAIAEANWIEESLAAARSASDVGMVAPAILMAADPERIESLGIEVSRAGFGYLRRWGKPWRDEAVHEVFAPSGAAAFYRREMLDGIGFFDPNFFAYYEDADLGWRARWAGYRCVAAPRARAHHRGSAHEALVNKRALLQRNRLLVIASDWTGRMILANIFQIIMWDFLSIINTFIEKKDMTAFKARLEFVKRLPWAIKRRSLLRNRAVGAERWLVDDTSRARARGLMP
jgi:GT2 family glycosyltransferase